MGFDQSTQQLEHLHKRACFCSVKKESFDDPDERSDTNKHSRAAARRS